MKLWHVRVSNIVRGEATIARSSPDEIVTHSRTIDIYYARCADFPINEAYPRDVITTI